MADVFAVAFFAAWTLLFWNAVRRADARLRSATQFRAATLLLETRRNG